MLINLWVRADLTEKKMVTAVAYIRDMLTKMQELADGYIKASEEG